MIPCKTGVLHALFLDVYSETEILLCHTELHCLNIIPHLKGICVDCNQRLCEPGVVLFAYVNATQGIIKHLIEWS